MRENLIQIRRDTINHKPYVTVLTERSDDCVRRKFALGAFVERDKAGGVVNQGPSGGGWQDISPGSVTEAIWKTVCAAAQPPKDKPFLASLTEGTWRTLGLDANRKYTLSVKSDEIVKLDETHAGSIQRSDYVKPEYIDGLPIRHMVTVTVIDCVNEQSASAGMDLYVSPSLRVRSMRVSAKDMKFEPMAPGSFLANSIRDLCGAAKPLKKAAAAKDQKSNKKAEFFTGTAWGADKGYLVTAAHVIDNAKAIDVYRDGDKVGEAKVVVADFANDLAILAFTKAPPGKLKILPMAEHGPALGRPVFTLGYPAPGILGQQVKMTSGQVNSTAGLQDDTRMLQISIPLQGGNSGGPVMSWDGAVVGIVDLKLNRLDENDEERPENVNYAVKSSYLRPMFEDLPDLGNHEPVKFGPTEEKTVAAVRDAVFMLLVAR
jgi:S1-C subfamily serine protease